MPDVKYQKTRKQSTWQNLLFSDHKICIKLQDWKYIGISTLYIVCRITDYDILCNKIPLLYSYYISIMLLPTTQDS